jgi:hypothetical protein
MKDILFEPAINYKTNYKLMNPIRGIVPGSPVKDQVHVSCATKGYLVCPTCKIVQLHDACKTGNSQKNLAFGD